MAKDRRRDQDIRRATLLGELKARRDRFTHVVGRPGHVEVERSHDERRVDHVWMNVEVAPVGSVRASINTRSLKNLHAGFEDRVKVGLVRGTYEALPQAGIYDAEPCSYADVESRENVFYQWEEQRVIEQLITTRAITAIWVEIWGELYVRGHIGIHEIHCRRASCAVPNEVVGRDGALRFYFERDSATELLLFEFCGQD